MATDMSPYLIVLAVITALVAVAGGLYVSPYRDDVAKYFAERFFAYKAKAEEKALEHVGEEKAQAFLYVLHFRLSSINKSKFSRRTNLGNPGFGWD